MKMKAHRLDPKPQYMFLYIFLYPILLPIHQLLQDNLINCLLLCGGWSSITKERCAIKNKSNNTKTSNKVMQYCTTWIGLIMLDILIIIFWDWGAHFYNSYLRFRSSAGAQLWYFALYVTAQNLHLSNNCIGTSCHLSCCWMLNLLQYSK